jgi:DNA polymerase III subunit epsilon
MKGRLLVFVDIESTGLDFLKHEIIEIAGVIVEQSEDGSFRVVEEFEYKIKPLRIHDAEPQALKVNHYDPSAWTEALLLSDAMKLVGEKTKDMIMVAHNVAFDSAFIDKAFKESGMKNPMHYHRLDTVSMAYIKLRNVPEVDHFSLHELCRYFGIENPNSHTALADARADFELYKKLITL